MNQLFERIVYETEKPLTYYAVDSVHSSPHRRKCIDGSVTGSGNCVGYCTFNDHPGYLTRRMRQAHDCIKKGCRYYLPKGKSESGKPVYERFAAGTVLIRAVL